MTLDELISKISYGKIVLSINYWYNYQGYFVKKDINTLYQKVDLYDYNFLKDYIVEECKIKLVTDEDNYTDSAILEVLLKEPTELDEEELFKMRQDWLNKHKENEE